MNDIARALQRPLHEVEAAATLLDAGHTIPFIARYRKELTGGMDDGTLRTLQEQLARRRALEARRADVLRLLKENGHATPELAQKVERAPSLQRLEDLYRPYRPRRRTRASVARERGLEPLAEWLLRRTDGHPEAEAERFVGDGVSDGPGALQGARDIVAERVGDDPELRTRVRDFLRERAFVHTKLRHRVGAEGRDEKRPSRRDGTASERRKVYEAYDDYEEPLRRIPPHRVLAVNRGEAEGVLRVRLGLSPADEERLLVLAENAMFAFAEGGRRPGEAPADEHLRAAARDGAQRLLRPSVERELRGELTEKAHEGALEVFRANLRALLLQAPLRGRVVVGLDPAYRTGVKVAVVDPTGRLLTTDVVYPTPPRNDVAGAARKLSAIVADYGVTAIAIGNGTASRETERFVSEWLRAQPEDRRPPYAVVDEAGASVYSASPLAQEEFPRLDVSERSAVSIARRLQDPLAELVKIEPRSLGVGQYQHDIDGKRLEEQLAGVVEAVVNEVGVDINTASAPLLSYVAGLSPAVARRIVVRREEEGPFVARRQLLDVPRLGPRTFQQCAGFLQIPDAPHPLDRTPIHPESYAAAEGLLAELNLKLGEIPRDGGGMPSRPSRVAAVLDRLTDRDVAKLADRLDVGEPTLRDIVAALRRPGRDPREDLPPPTLRSDVLTLDDLTPGMTLSGAVRNVVDFGAFVDIGVGQDGLVHISELADRFVRHPLDVVAVGDDVVVRVLDVDKGRGRIALSMKGVPPPG